MAHRNIRKNRTTKKLQAEDKPVLSINRSNKHLAAQISHNGKTIATVTSNNIKKGTKTEKASALGKIAAEKAKKLKIESMIFNRSGYIYHGRIKAFVDAVRENIKI